MKVENIVRERSYTEKNTYCMNSFVRNVQKRKMYTKQSRSVVSWGWKLKDRMTANSLDEILGSVEKL